MANFNHYFVYLRANGYFQSTSAPVEQWSVGFKLQQNTAAQSTAGLQAFLETVSGPIATFHGSSNLKAGTTVFLKELTAAVIGLDGKYVGGGAQPTVVRPYTTPVPGSGSVIHSMSTACVLSLRTTFGRGRASNGRAYWPAAAIAVQNVTGLISSTDTLAIATAAGTMLNSINQAADSILDDNQGLYVMSNHASPTSAPVIAVRVGNKVDHQERREKSIKETYSQVSVTLVPALAARVRDLNFGEVTDLSSDD